MNVMLEMITSMTMMLVLYAWAADAPTASLQLGHGAADAVVARNRAAGASIAARRSNELRALGIMDSIIGIAGRPL